MVVVLRAQWVTYPSSFFTTIVAAAAAAAASPYYYYTQYTVVTKETGWQVDRIGCVHAIHAKFSKPHLISINMYVLF